MNRGRAWWLAARPPTLWAAVAPVLVGGGLAWGSGPAASRVFRADAFLAALIGALAIQIAANYANDLSDARRGADSPDRIGPTRMVAAGIITERQMGAGVVAALGVAVLAGVYLIAVAGWVIILIGLSAIVAALTYVGGPRPYGYRALGELSVFVFFGVVATVGSRYVHDRTAPADAWLLAIPVGLLVTAILVANNVRDLDTDRRANKRTLAVLLGRRRTRWLYTGLLGSAFAAIGVFAVLGWTPPWTALALVAAPAVVPLVRVVGRETAGPPLIRALQGTARLHAAVGVLLALGAAIG